MQMVVGAPGFDLPAALANARRSLLTAAILAQRLLQVGDDVGGVLEADGEAEEPVAGVLAVGRLLRRRPCGTTSSAGPPSAGRRSGCGGAPGTRRSGPSGASARAGAPAPGPSSTWNETMPAELPHLPAREVVLRVRREPRVEHARHPGCALEELRHRQRALLVRAHAHGQGRDAAHDQPGVEGAEHAAHVDRGPRRTWVQVLARSRAAPRPRRRRGRRCTWSASAGRSPRPARPGRVATGVAKVESTASFAPASCVTRATAAMSVSRRIGFAGVST